MPRCARQQRPPRREPSTALQDLYQRNAALENALKFIGHHACLYRERGECLLDCLGAVVCDTTDLRLVPLLGPETRT